MKKLIVGIVIAFCSPVNACAQTVTIMNASRQDWSGGIAGHYGTNYSITLKLSPENIQLDSVYISNFCIKISNVYGGNVLKDTVHHTYTIIAQESHDEYNENGYSGHNPGLPPAAKKHFAGAALIVYEYKGKQYSLIVKKFQALEPLAYP